MKKRDVFDKCEVEGCLNVTRTQGVKHCSKHLSQLQRYGKILERTIYDPNKIEILETHALLHLYDKDCNVKAKALIDLDDVERVSKHKWRFGNGIYVDNPKVGFLHKFIANSSIEQDHINRNKLDNRKDNLRPCEHVQNCQNRDKPSNNTSGAKGVCFKTRTKKFDAYITLNGKNKHLGCFVDLISAAESYNEMAVKHFGEFALLNDIEALKLKELK